MQVLKPFDPWKSSLCSCPPKYGLSPYTGCSHGCRYCYASSYIPRFSQPRPKKDFLARLEKDLARLPSGTTVTMANSSDPYLPAERSLQLTRQTLRRFVSAEVRLMIVTKSDLILRDLDVLSQCPQVVVAISISTLDPAVAALLEPRAPAPEARLAAMRTLSGSIPVLCRLDPLIFPLTTRDLQETVRVIAACGARHIVSSTYKTRPDNFRRMCAVFPEYAAYWQDLYPRRIRKRSGSRYLAEDLRRELLQQVRAAALAEGLDFSTCREGFTEMHTAECDGRALFSSAAS
ncbi:MAG: radical SAM protein [Candidatus Omnitrophica bacterium]|nr:radical SAM protein [Candidatus Omnitrophota bacterium]